MKRWMLAVLTIIILGILITVVMATRKKEVENSPYNFYINSYKERYESFMKENPSLSEKDVIIRVNLHLDKMFYTDTKKSEYLNSDYVLVNKYNYLEEDYVPNNLEVIEYCTSGVKYLVSNAKQEFIKMCNALKEENLNLRVISSYRDFSYQKRLYDNYLKKDSVENVDTYSARPGFSEHQTGLVIDVDNYVNDFNDFENTDEYKWMIDNSYKYGFILRYPVGKEDITGYKYEAWHYRYVGKEIASFIFNNNITFDEYYAMFLQKEN